MNIKLQANEQLSATVANGLAGVFINGVSLSASLSSASGKVYFDNRISGIIGSNDLSVVKLSVDEYAQMLEDGTCLSNAIYIVEAPNIDAFKQRITNVASPTDLSDAATKEYVDNAVGSSGSGQLSAKLDASAAWPAWVAGELYDLNQVVSHNGKLWKANGPSPAWEPGSSQGVDWLSVDINSILTANYQPKGNYLTAVPTTYKTYSQTAAALSNDGYATQTQVNQKSTVSFSRITTSGTNIGSITIDGTTTQIYAPTGGSGGGSSVQVSADYSTGTRVATISVDNVPTSIYVPNSSGGSSRYALETAQLVADNGSLTCAVNDQAITTIQVSSSTTPVVVQLPAEPTDGARDFILRIEISSSAAPTFTFNGVNETIDFDSEDDDWAVMEPGLNLVSFTETKRGTNYVGGGSND